MHSKNDMISSAFARFLQRKIDKVTHFSSHVWSLKWSEMTNNRPSKHQQQPLIAEWVRLWWKIIDAQLPDWLMSRSPQTTAKRFRKRCYNFLSNHLSETDIRDHQQLEAWSWRPWEIFLSSTSQWSRYPEWWQLMLVKNGPWTCAKRVKKPETRVSRRVLCLPLKNSKQLSVFS